MESFTHYLDEISTIRVLRKSLISIGFIPTIMEYIKLGLPPSVTTIRKWGYSYITAIEKAGFQYPHKKGYGGKRKNRICPGCHVVFIPNNNRHKYCVKNCRDRIKHTKYREIRSLEKECPQCGGVWIEPKETHRGKPKHCLKCQEYYRNRYKLRRNGDVSQH